MLNHGAVRSITFQAHLVILLMALLVGASAWGAGRVVASAAAGNARLQNDVQAVSEAFLDAEAAVDGYLNTGSPAIARLAATAMTRLNQVEKRGFQAFPGNDATARAFAAAQTSIRDWYTLALNGYTKLEHNKHVSVGELLALQGYADAYQRESDALVRRLVDEGNHSTYVANLWTVLGAGLCAALIAVFAELAVVRRERRDRGSREAHAAFVEQLLSVADKAAAYELLERRLQALSRGARVAVIRPGEPAVEPQGAPAVRRFQLAFAGQELGAALIWGRGRLNPVAQTQIQVALAAAAPMIANLQDLAEARDHALTDGLTGIANRRALEQEIVRICARATRSGEPFGVILADVDHFKRLNDTLGHDAGDRALIGVAKLLSERARVGDVVARYGGEEFLVLCPGADLAACGVVAESLRVAIEQHEALPARLTASFGVAAFPASAADPGALVRAADGALYAAKQAGRNRVAHAPSAGERAVS